MGSQIGIIGTAEDLLDLLGVARELGAWAVPELIPLDDPPELHDPVELFLENPDGRLYLLAAGLAPVEIRPLELIDRPGEATVHDRISPVVEFAPSRVVDGAMCNGRLYLGLSPSASLYRAARRLFDALRRHADKWPRTEQYDIRVGRCAAERARSGELTLEANTGKRLTVADPK
jgi:hypothetical protein